ncbi:MAG: YigZ family protein [Treponemataceae bacterium]|nr:YigZ family protein [Treponemataceae bacterium]
MYILNDRTGCELIVKGSRFLAEVIPVESQSQARDMLKSQKTKYADATHVVHAFVTGLAAEVMGMSDDGEPAGTAGRPVLDVLKGRGITNILLTVTRWFGGTLLGTGGLVKAYGDSAKMVLDKVLAEKLAEEYVEKRDFSFAVAYDLYEKVKYMLKDFTVSTLSEDFGEKVTLSGRIVSSEFETFAGRIKDMTNGGVVL